MKRLAPAVALRSTSCNAHPVWLQVLIDGHLRCGLTIFADTVRVASNADKALILATGMQAEFLAVKEEMNKGKLRANKLHTRLDTLTGGYARRADALVASLHQLYSKAQEVCSPLIS